MSDRILNPFEESMLPFNEWTMTAVLWITDNFRPAFQQARWPVAVILNNIQSLLTQCPQTIVLLVVFLLMWRASGVKLAIFSVVSLAFLGLIGLWRETMVTVALMATAVLFSIVVGIPLGIWAARSDRVEAIIRPILDVMQTLPAFVYLVPIVMLVGIGNVPGVIITVIYAVPPLIRMTNLGIRGVPHSTVEAAYAFGSKPFQVLLKVQFPLAVRAIMAGINQTIMLALGMVVYASMIAVDGLGLVVLRAIGSLDMGGAVSGGIGIVLLAMMLDRMTQAIAQTKRVKASAKVKDPMWKRLSGYSAAKPGT